MGFFEKIRDGLKKTRDSISGQISLMVNSFTKIDEELFEELEELLVMGDVGMETATFITDELRKKVKEKGITDPSLIMGELKAIVAELLQGDDSLHLSTKPSVILMIGVNGAGKTTTIGKLAAQMKAEGKSVILGAADTFRAAAIEQLEVWAERAGVPMIKHGEGADPAAVVFDTIAAAKARGCDVVICDTAGRLHNKKNLMDELAKISRIIDRELPGCDRETLLVLDATTGQNAVNQAREFQNAANITGIVLTKLDGTPKGGVVLPIKQALGLSVKYIGVGEKIDDLQPFDANDFAEALFAGNEPDRHEPVTDTFVDAEPVSEVEPEIEAEPEMEEVAVEMEQEIAPVSEIATEPAPETVGESEPDHEEKAETEAESKTNDEPVEEQPKKHRFWPFGRKK